jgi:GAF domain-containing protein
MDDTPAPKQTVDIAGQQQPAAQNRALIAASTEVLRAISASPGDPQPVFELIVRRTRELCNAQAGSLVEFDGTLMYQRVQQGFTSEAMARLHAAFPRAPGQDTLPGRVVLSGRIVQTDPDLIQPERSLAVPLMREGGVIGVLGLTRFDIGVFDEAAIELAQCFAEQAVVAISGAATLRELRTRTAELAQRNSEYGERIEHQSATIDVLRAMSASPGDPQPVFDLIVERARDICGAYGAGVWEFDGRLIHYRAGTGTSDDPEARRAMEAMYPMVPSRDWHVGRVVLDKQLTRVDDYDTDPNPALHGLTAKSSVMVPLMRGAEVIGVVGIGSREKGGFSDSQIELLKTFAEQAVIAIGSAETWRALQTRTADLQESLEFQTATSDVLKVISRSTFDLQPVLDAVTETAVRLCDADQGVIFRLEGVFGRLVANYGFPPEYEALQRARGLFDSRSEPSSISTAATAMREARIVHIPDVAAVPGYPDAPVRLGKQRTGLGVPLMWNGKTIGAFALARQRVEPFTERQIEVVSTFADQAAIAIENARLLGELQERTEALTQRNSEFGERIEHQAATIDVLKAMSASPGDPQPVFDLIVQRARDLCGAYGVTILEFDGQLLHRRASTGVSEDPKVSQALAALYPRPPTRDMPNGRAVLDRRIIRFDDYDAENDLNPIYRNLTAKSGVFVPLMRGDSVVGTVGMGSGTKGGFSDSQVELLKTFAEQAVIAITSAETYRALQERTAALAQRNSEFGERIEQQAATIDVLKVMSSTPDDTHPVFEQIVRRATELCNGVATGLFEYDGELVHFRILRNRDDGEGHFDPAAYEAYKSQFPMKPTRGSISCRAILDKKIIHIRDSEDDPELSDVVRNLLRTSQRSQVSIPLLRDGQAIGCISLARAEPGGFTDSQIALLQTFAEQAVIAITSVANFRALRERTAELTRSVAELQALEEVLRAVNSSLDLDTVLTTIVNRAVRLSRADEGLIYEFDEAEQVFVPKSAYGMSADRIARIRERRIKLGETWLGRSALERTPVYVEDVQNDPAIRDTGDLLQGIHAVLAVPLLREGKVIGGMVIRRRVEGGFAPTTVTLMQTFAGQCVLAIENARLFKELAERGEEARRARVTAEATLADLRRAQDRLVQSEKMASLGQLTAGIAHEIKNPLNFVNNFSDLSADLLDELNDAVAPEKLAVAPELRAEIDEITATLKGNLEKIAQHGRRADSIVKNMLLHSRTGPSEHRQIDLNATVEEALNLAYHGARAETPGFNITLAKQFDPKAGMIDAYPQEISRVRLNLMSNGFYAAHKRTAAGTGFEPTLTVTTRDLGDHAEIRVRDNGTGIPAEIREKIFEPFFTTKPAGEGTGLGLSLSYDIVVKQHNGQLNVDSSIDQFTEFTITLPRRMAGGEA